MSNSFYLAACLLGFIWLTGLWKSVQRAFPNPNGGHPIYRDEIPLADIRSATISRTAMQERYALVP